MFIARWIIGSVFLFSGFQKAIVPYQNFLYNLQAYQLIPSGLDTIIAMVFPWVELFLGLFIVLGLWTAVALRIASVFNAVFIVVIGQALLRAIPLGNCGCFGESIHIPPAVMIIVDSVMLLISILMLKRFNQTQRFSLDSILK